MRRPHRNIEIFSMSALDLFASALGGFVLIAIMLFPYYNKYTVAEAAATAAIEAQEEAETIAEAAKEAEEAAQAAADAAEAAKELAESQLDQTEKERDEAIQLAEEAQRLAEVAMQESEEAKIEVAQLVEAQQEQQQQIDSLRQQVARTFLIVQIQWQLNFDIDMYVTDPEGREFRWNRSNASGADYPGVLTQLSVDNITGPGIEVWQAPDASPGIYRVALYLLGASVDVPVALKVFFRNGVETIEEINMSAAQPEYVFEIEVTEQGSVEIMS
jgi:flagellar motor protein MotB